MLIFLFLKQDTEDIGDVYQDVGNQAAILVYKDKHDGAILMVCIVFRNKRNNTVTCLNVNGIRKHSN